MKKITRFSAVSFLMLGLLALVSCESTKVNLAQYPTAAIVSISSNSTMPWYETETGNGKEKTDDSAGLLSSSIGKYWDSNNPEISSLGNRVDYSLEKLTSCLEDAGVNVLPHSDVACTDSYQAALKNWLNLGDTDYIPEGYAKISGGSTQRNRAFLEETGADSVIYVSFVFKKMKYSSGLFETRVKAYVKMNVTVAAGTGKCVARKTYEVQSNDSVAYNNGKWDSQAVVDLFPDTIDMAIGAFMKDFYPMPEIEAAEVDAAATVEESSEDEYIPSEDEVVIMGLDFLRHKVDSEGTVEETVEAVTEESAE